MSQHEEEPREEPEAKRIKIELTPENVVCAVNSSKGRMYDENKDRGSIRVNRVPKHSSVLVIGIDKNYGTTALYKEKKLTEIESKTIDLFWLLDSEEQKASSQVMFWNLVTTGIDEEIDEKCILAEGFYDNLVRNAEKKGAQAALPEKKEFLQDCYHIIAGAKEEGWMRIEKMEVINWLISALDCHVMALEL